MGGKEYFFTVGGREVLRGALERQFIYIKGERIGTEGLRSYKFSFRRILIIGWDGLWSREPLL